MAGNAHFVERVGDALGTFRCLELRLVNSKPFGDDLANVEPRREAAERILEDDLHARPQLAQRAAVKACQFAAFEADMAFGGFEPQQGEARGRFARAAFTDEADGLAFVAP